MYFVKTHVLAAIGVALLISACAGTGGSGASDAEANKSPQQKLHDQAVALMLSGNSVQAEKTLQQLTNDYPRYASPWLNLALIYHKRGNAAMSQASLEQALAIDSAFAAAWNLQGVLHREAENIDAAEAAYREALNADGSYAPAWLNLGILLEIYRSRFDAALRAYQRYQELAPADAVDPRVAGWIADLQRRLDRGV